jgi:16S rRNA (guanine966-N2)-methyltransferase
MRVIGGIHRGRRLRTAPGLSVRPTSDRLRETLFNILAPAIDGAHFLDICAGSGAIGIEALSRGAGHVTFIEQSPRACSVISDNLGLLGLTGSAVVINREASNALRLLTKRAEQFDIAFLDPPYASPLYDAVMAVLARTNLIHDKGLIVLEHRAKNSPEAEYGALRAYRTLKHGESALTFYSAASDLNSAGSPRVPGDQ